MARPVRNRFAAASRLTCSSIPCRPPRPGDSTGGGAGSLIDFQPLYPHRGRAPPRRGRCTAPDGCLRPRIFAAACGPFVAPSRCRPGTALWSTVAGTRKDPATRRGLLLFSAFDQRKLTHYLHVRRACAWYNRHVALKPRSPPRISPAGVGSTSGLATDCTPARPVSRRSGGFLFQGGKRGHPPPHRRQAPPARRSHPFAVSNLRIFERPEVSRPAALGHRARERAFACSHLRTAKEGGLGKPGRRAGVCRECGRRRIRSGKGGGRARKRPRPSRAGAGGPLPGRRPSIPGSGTGRHRAACAPPLSEHGSSDVASS